jgi:hypothetical protein
MERLYYSLPPVIFGKLSYALVKQHARVLHSTAQHTAAAVNIAAVCILISWAHLWQELIGH